MDQREEGVSVKIARAEVSESGSKFNFKPKLEMSASISKYGAIFDKIIYSDIFSTLNGSAQGLWNINNGIFDSASLEFNLQNKKSTEAASVTASVSNVAKDENISRTEETGDVIQEKLRKLLEEIKQQEEIIKQAILSEMEAENILSIETDDLKISYVAPFDRETFDTKTFQKENQELYDNYVKMTPVKSSIRIKLKE